MGKVFKTKDEFIRVISTITNDGSVIMSLTGETPEVPKEKQFAFVEEAIKMDFSACMDQMPTALRFELIKEGYEDLIEGLKFEELDGPDDYWPGRMTSYILRKFPDHESKIDWGKLKNIWLAQVIIDQPQFLEKADLSKLDSRSSAELISKRPELAAHFNLSVFNSPENSQYWFRILEKQPQFAEACDWGLINDYQKKKLKEIHPSLEIKP